jgi:hypothetical protein
MGKNLKNSSSAKSQEICYYQIYQTFLLQKAAPRIKAKRIRSGKKGAKKNNIFKPTNLTDQKKVNKMDKFVKTIRLVCKCLASNELYFWHTGIWDLGSEHSGTEFCGFFLK